jgi:6-phosphogluconolactonase
MNILKTVSVISLMPIVATSLFSAEGGGAPAAKTDRFFVYFGTYTGQKSKGIYVSQLDAATGKLTDPELTAETQNPTFLAIHPALPALYSTERPTLYAANETGGGGRSGSVTAYTINRETGKLTLLNRQSSRGAGPCHVSVDRSGQCVLVANYGGGNIAALPVNKDGSVAEASAFIQHTGSGPNKQRQEAPHAHWIDVDPGNRFAFVCDLGLDKVMSYKLDPAQGSLTANDPAFTAVKAGSGPRHLAFHPNGKYAYLINEMGNTVIAFAYDAARGGLTELQSVPTLPPDFTRASTTAEIEVHPSGKFLYGSNRGFNSIVVYAIDEATGKLTLVEQQPSLGRTPRNFAIDPTGRWLLAAHQDSDNVVVFSLDPQTGRLKPTGQSLEVGKPVCIKFVPVK